MAGNGNESQSSPGPAVGVQQRPAPASVPSPAVSPGESQSFKSSRFSNSVLVRAAGPYAPTSTFVLDPALNVAPPANVTTHVRVAGLTFGGRPGPDRYLQIDRPVRSAARHTVYAVPLSDVYDDPAEAAAAIASDPWRSPGPLARGALAWTAGGDQFTVGAVAGDVVLTEDAVAEAVGAGAAIAVETDAGRILLDLGLQVHDHGCAEPIGEEMARLLGSRPPPAFSEAVLMHRGPGAHLLPYLARHFAIGEIRATVDQYADARTTETVTAVRSAQTEFRRRLVDSLRHELENGRAAWEAQQPIAVNAGAREARWKRYVEGEVAVLLGTVPPPQLMLAEESFGTITALTGGPAEQAADAPPAALVDVTAVEWVPADDDGLLAIVAGDRLVLLPSYGWLLRPKTPASVTVPGLRPSGPTGPTPLGQRPATPWITAPAMGKGALVVVRFADGLGFLIDAGSDSPRLITDAAMARVMAVAGVAKVEAQLITHIHRDHINLVVDMVRRFGIKADKIIMSRSWVGSARGAWAEVLTELRAVFGKTWEPGLALESQAAGVTEATVPLSGDRTVRVLARGKVQREYREEGGPEKKTDPASLLFIFGNETSGHRAMVLGDVRGEDIGKFATEMGLDAFRSALEGVRVLVGFGHHFSLVAGQNSAADVAGLELLIRETLLRNGELTIVVQSSEGFSFGTQPLDAQARALLNFATRMGARVIFADKPASGAVDAAAVLNSDLSVAATGRGITQFNPDPRTAAALERLQMLREARRTVAENPELGPRRLRSVRPAPELLAALDAEVARLEDHFFDLLGREAATLFELRGDLPARAGESEARRVARTAAAKADFRAARTRPDALTDDQLRAELARPGPVESALPADVVAGLRAATRHGSTLTVEAELLATPRGVAEAIGRLPQARRTALEREYRELQELSAAITGDDVPAEKAGELSLRMAALRNELSGALTELTELTAEQRLPLEAEMNRVTAVLAKLTTALPGAGISRTTAGAVGTTEFLLINASRAINWGVGAAGRGFGAVMMVHSVSGLGDTAAGLAAGTVNVPEALIKVTHDAMGLQLGIKMFMVQPVSTGRFAILVLLEVGAAAFADYATPEERNLAVLRAGLHGAVNLLCMMAGMKVMTAGAALGPTPAGAATVLGGFVLTMAGEPVLRLLGADEAMVRWTQFGPGDVTKVYQKIDKTLDQYEMAIGSVLLAERDEATLAGLGAAHPAELKKRAAEASTAYRAKARDNEAKLIGLFEDAYAEAATSYIGLRNLDLLAERFTQLRHRAMGGEPGRAELQQRFTAIDTGLGRIAAEPAEIAGMDQWDELKDQLDDAGKELDEKPPRWDKLFLALDRAQQMIDNARYRIEPNPLRPVPIIRRDSPSWSAYVEHLNGHDRRLAGLLRRAAELGGSAAAPVSAADPRFAGLVGDVVDPRSALARLQSLRVAYDERVREGVAALPTLASTQTWSDSYRLGRRNEEAHASHPDLFRRLRLTEMALRAAIGQAGSSVRVAEGPADPKLTTLIQTEITSAERAVEERRLRHGLLLPAELEDELTQRRASEDRLLAARVDAAFARPGAGPAPSPLGPEEVKALHGGELKSIGSGMSSTEHQLDEATRLMAPARETDRPPFEYEKMHRMQRRLAVIAGPKFWTLDTHGVDTTEEHTLPAGTTYLVAWIPGEAELAPKHWHNFSSTFVRVLPINADAVAKFGSDIVYLSADGLRFVETEDIVVRPTASAAP